VSWLIGPESRVHVIIHDSNETVYQVPEDIVPRPTGSSKADDARLEVLLEEEPFSFTVKRRDSEEVLFSTKGTKLIFESQYLRLRTSLPDEPNLYGLGEHTDPLKLPTTNYTRTLWNRDAGGVPVGQNLYGAHPVYFDYRHGVKAAHGVALINSNGMDVKIDKDEGRYLEYNILGGVFDLYFLAGPNPFEVARQYSEISAKAAMMPYWGFGSHQCRFGYNNIDEVSDVVTNYSKAGIPLETMWTDIVRIRQPLSGDIS
jgi:alpha-glucosidase